jgi:hypothetical protein
MSESFNDLLDSIRAKDRKVAILLDQLRLWREAQAQGIDSRQGGPLAWTRSFLRRLKGGSIVRIPTDLSKSNHRGVIECFGIIVSGILIDAKYGSIQCWRHRLVNSVAVLFEVKRGEHWYPVRIARQLADIHEALDALPVFAKQQRTEVDQVRVRSLRTPAALYAAEQDIIEAHRKQLDD